MSKSLVIVESPAKAKTINKYLGKEFIVKSSVGHIRDLPTSASDAEDLGEKAKSKSDKSKSKSGDAKKTKADALFRKMAVDPTNGWKAHYVILPGKEKILKELRELATKSDRVYLATDLDREGEAIAWHLQEAIGGDPKKFQRVTFAEITEKAIKSAFARPGTLNMNRVNAQQARRFLDRVVGFMLSPLLWKKIARGLSAGRVQSVALRMVEERENEIRSFKTEEYWQIFANLAKGGKNGAKFSAELVKIGNETAKIGDGSMAKKITDDLENAEFIVREQIQKPTTAKPSAPFITSTLQQAGSVRLGFGVKKTMMLAQRLYESGYITYMRTDSTFLGEDAVNNVRSFIKDQYGDKYLPEQKNTYASKEKAQEAHEAIRPSDVLVSAQQLSDVDPDAVRLYDLIWRQFVACQMTPAQYDTSTINIQNGNYLLRAKGRIMRFDGWLKVIPALNKKNEEDILLPECSVSDRLDLVNLNAEQKFTKPSPRFTEASLVKGLEARGIGRPSTYATIISTIQDRGYVKVEKKRFFLQKMGEIVSLRLKENFPELMGYDFTANLEDNLDEIALGHADWANILDKFYEKFNEDVLSAEEGMRPNDPTEISYPCPKCGRNMAIRTAKTGVFLSCTGYGLAKDERCKETVNLQPGEEVVSISQDDEEGDVEEIRSKLRCEKCDSLMDSYLIDETKKLHVCGRSPDCNGYKIEEGQFKIKGYDGPVIECDICHAEMQLRTGRFGKYFACVKYPECKNTRKLLRNGEAAPPKVEPVHMPELGCEKSDGYFVLRDGAAGLFLASSKFPKSRETRVPSVEDFVRHKDEIPEKYKFIALGPTEDDKGRKAVVRFKRKEKEHYLRTEENGKPTGWTAHWDGQRWEVSQSK